MILSLALLGAGFQLSSVVQQQQQPADSSSSGSSGSWLVLLGLCCYLLFFAPGMGPLPWTVNAEIYPLWARSTGISMATATNWACNLAVSMTFLSLTEVVTPHVRMCNSWGGH